MKCKAYWFLYKVFPLTFLRSLFIDRHFSSCPACSAKLADDAELEKIVPGAQAAAGDVDLWPRVRRDIKALATSRGERRIGWAARPLRLGFAAAAVLLVLLLLPLLLDRDGGVEPAVSKEGRQIVIKSLTIENRPARSFYFQSKDENKLIVWVKKT